MISDLIIIDCQYLNRPAVELTELLSHVSLGVCTDPPVNMSSRKTVYCKRQTPLVKRQPM